MSNSIVDKLKDKITSRHEGDASQLDVIFSPYNRLLVEAPAGYGKTNTMISKIAHMLVTQQIPYPKRLLALTFSVNAAYKIKKDVNKQIPELLEDTGLSIDLGEKLFVSNYHGFCRSVLKKYGYLIHTSLYDIDRLQSIDDSDTKMLMDSVKGLSYEDAMSLTNYNSAVKRIDLKSLSEHFNEYNDSVIKSVLPEGAIPYNAILTLAIKLFTDHPNILEFYQRYFTAILVDEYQDTNALSYKLITHLITDKSKVILLGDSLQRIYGFIGAVPNLLPISEKRFGLVRYQLNMNHRFAYNPRMLQLDFNIRKNAENPSGPTVTKDALVELDVLPDQITESSHIIDKASSLIRDNPGSKLAILVRQRGPNVDLIIDAFDKHNIPYFFSLFTDDDVAYVKFHRECVSEFMSLIKLKGRVTRTVATSHVEKIKKIFDENPLNNSLIVLLQIFWSRVFSDFAFLSNEDKISLIKDTFEYNSLKQYIEFTNTNVIISTIHASKGLEWDFVLLPDMEQNRFPSWYGLCDKCSCRADCTLVVNQQIEKYFLEELSVFYVAVTRAKKQVIFSASELQLDSHKQNKPCNVSCFLGMPGIKTVVKQ